jgi:rfaE bifunctional protein nucleotidyltransferase chain/domain
MAQKRTKLQPLTSVLKAVHVARAQGKRIVTTNGVFDLLHVGHIKTLEHAKSLGDFLVVGVNADASVRLNKGRHRPIVPARERARILAALEVVDCVFIFSQPTVHSWIVRIKPDIHVKGSDRTLADVLERAAVERYGGKVILTPHTRRHSTTGIIEKIKQGIEGL